MLLNSNLDSTKEFLTMIPHRPYSLRYVSFASLFAAIALPLIAVQPLFAEDAPKAKSVPAIDGTDAQGKAIFKYDIEAAMKIPIEELEFTVNPLTKEELVVEADAWRDLLKHKVADISEEEINLRRKNQEIAEAEAKADEAAAQKEKAEEVAEEAKKEVEETADKPIADPDVTNAEIKKEAAEQDKEVAEKQEVQAKQEAEAKAEEKTEKLDKIVQLRNERKKIVDRLNVVLTELDAKGGERKPYDRYVDAVSGLKLDVTDTSAAWATVKGWITSEEGGLRWLKNIAFFLLTMLAFWILARIVARAVRNAVKRARGMSSLLRDFLVMLARRVVIVIGLIVALGQLEIDISPLIAAIGAAGFVIAFALQGTLSNFASGLLILIYRPYDVGDVVDVSGVSGVVESMNLMTTTIKSFDNQRIVVPNNNIWGNVITTVTGYPTRRVDLVFGIGYADDYDKARDILMNIITSHPKVLKDPEPNVKVHELADSSVNLICRPWTKTEDYWAVYWDVMREVKKRFDEEGVSIPFPQRDVHVYHEKLDAQPAEG